MSEFTCRDCHWFKPDGAATPDRDITPWGECRRQAPRLMFSRHTDDTSSAWPPVSSDDWCGEFALNRQLRLALPERQSP